MLKLHSYKGFFYLLLVLGTFASCTPASEPENQNMEEEVLLENPQHLMQKTYQFELGTDSLEVQLALDTNLRQKYLQAPHNYTYQGNKLPPNWREEYYRMFVQHPDDRRAIGNLLQSLKQVRPGLHPDEMVELVVAFVQGSVTYDWNTYHNIDQSQIRYPYETLVDGTGVCADKTILLARLLDELGYGLAVFTYERANHMALGIRVPQGYDNYRSGYAFVESTNYAPIGRIPNNYVGGLKLDPRPTVIPLNSANKTFDKIIANQKEEKELERKFGKDYFFLSSEQKQIKAEMVGLEAELDSLKKEMRGCRGTLPPDKFKRCNELQQEHNSRVEKYNGLVARFNALNKDSQSPA